jgi:hypothetical protein
VAVELGNFRDRAFERANVPTFDGQIYARSVKLKGAILVPI